MRVRDDSGVTLGLISGTEFRRRFEESCASAGKLTIVSAYITLPAVRWLSNFWKQECRVLCRLSVSDMLHGASDIEALKMAISLGWTVFFDESIHSKLYMVENGPLFIGSANFTSNGIGLSRNSNSETMTIISPSRDDMTYVSELFAEAQCLDMKLALKMEDFVSEFKWEAEKTIPTQWPEYISAQNSVLKVSDFPLVGPGEICREYVQQPDLTFAEIADWCKTPGAIRTALLDTKAYRWLKFVLLQEEHSQAWYGYLTSRLHDDLADDPAPYRRTVKELLSNLLCFCECYMKSEIIVERPRQSQLVKYISKSK